MNTFGDTFRVTTWGESHGKALGAVIDGCPSNLPLTENDIQYELNRRRPGYSLFSTPRKEEDEVEILSGIFEGKTTGTPISCIVYNKSQQSKDYTAIKDTPRPGHADLSYQLKYGNYDYRGGGRSSGRTTIGNVIGGAIAKKLIEYTHKIKVIGYTTEIGTIKGDFNYYNNPEFFESDLNIQKLSNQIEDSVLRCPSTNSNEMNEYVFKAIDGKDSVGGVVEVVIYGLPKGIGNPIFNKLEGRLSSAVMSINSIKGFEVGKGFESSRLFGSEMNDEFYFKNGIICPKTNNAGGILGGISTGAPVVIRASIKPTPSISKTQETVNIKTLETVPIKIGGRHDPIIVPRVIPVIESMVSITIADLMISSGFINPSKLSNI
ncbi:chorismate synthase [Methanococcus vannielii]|uniref:chorismate synthase n=1 Tax=Methanococcus vannielii TaxID=2187 RepID=UPI00064E4101|nr:chorismate synthase [Methanococcus vannielii]